MEEQVGTLWHRAITRLSQRRHPQAAVTLAEVAGGIGILFRALGGDGGLQVESTEASAHGARRGLLQRIAGLDDKAELAWRDARALGLPARFVRFPERSLNRDPYLWLAALAAQQRAPSSDWLVESQALTALALSRCPGLRPRYQRLLAAHLETRPDPRRLRHQFQALAPARLWQRGQSDGQEVDLDAYLRFATARHAGAGTHGDGLYRDMRRGARDLVCLLLSDLSLSTDTWIDDRTRVIDVIRDSLFLFAESLAATGDRFAMLGFSSRRRDPVRVHSLKDFDEPHGTAVRSRIAAIKPGDYTRMGAAIRYASRQLGAQPGGRRLLLILSDGKPNDLDRYAGRHGIEDTRRAVHEARRAGLSCFCVTIDQQGNDYLPHLFGTGGYIVLRRPAELPKRLPLLYARLTASDSR